MRRNVLRGLSRCVHGRGGATELETTLGGFALPQGCHKQNRLGVDRSYVSGLELGTRNATIVTLWHVSQALGVTFQGIFAEGTKRTRRSKGS
ncbi:helix-turn-helix transcriptional regulator [Bradyrhizobium sp. 162]|uniref:helix-turn-helix domain-containing protein n=1 Tax=Bradyrhizobium sp. 162 TaxID=2782635 RepID=UPI001FF796F8|nr:helix-turn-helix transcriptional regulator [Bradyrhizobium sp. 162]